jgi:hypothetical protein
MDENDIKGINQWLKSRTTESDLFAIADKDVVHGLLREQEEALRLENKRKRRNMGLVQLKDSLLSLLVGCLLGAFIMPFILNAFFKTDFSAFLLGALIGAFLAFFGKKFYKNFF